jgi:capsular polysaccharide biosynthesis protein
MISIYIAVSLNTLNTLIQRIEKIEKSRVFGVLGQLNSPSNAEYGGKRIGAHLTKGVTNG